MASYRVGEAGATVFDAEGKPLLRLPPGSVVIAGTTDTAGSVHAGLKRRLPHADKARRPGRDYSTPEMSHEDKQA